MHIKNPVSARLFATLAWLFALSSCGSRESVGSAQLVGSLQQAVTTSDITRVDVTVSAADMATRTESLVMTDGVWGGILGHLPSGTNRTFVADAFDASGTKRFSGQATGVTITAGQTSLVALTLHEVGPTAPAFDNAAPLIDSLVAATSTVTPGGYLSITATAHDPDPSDTLSYAWSSTAGGFYAPASPSTTWWAPSEQGPVTLTLTVTDSRGATATLSFTLEVRTADGAAAIQILFNTTPAISRMTASPSRVDMGETTTVIATASDGDGDTLSYQWTAACAGTWANASSATAQFTPSTRPSPDSCADCPLAVTVMDTHGGQTTGTFHLCVGPTSAVRIPPHIVSSYQSSQTVPTSGPVTLRVTAVDSQAGALTFHWSALAGTLAAPSSDATHSEVQWTAPACVPANTPLSVTATVVNAQGLSASTTFTMTGGATCEQDSGGFLPTGDMVDTSHKILTLLPSGKVLALSSSKATAELYDPATRTWSSAASMAPDHFASTATLLFSGKVLVVRSDAAAAELYDPATDTWTPTGNTQEVRGGATATRLLSGKVLVVSSTTPAATAELYDPVTGTWTPAGTLSFPHSTHTATLLLSGKVLIVGGSDNPAEVYDPSTGSWSLTGPLHAFRYLHTATLLPSGRVLVTGGGSSDTEVYDEGTNSWIVTSPISVGRIEHAATLLPSGKVLVTGGLGSVPVSTAEVYDPATDSWARTNTLLVPRIQHAALLLPSGKVLIVGGQFGGGRFAELYAPAQVSAWSPTQSMSEARVMLTATVLPSGKVLAAGGNSNSAELYDPATGLWGPTGGMTTSRSAHTATLLPSGRVLVTGGTTSTVAELYDPTTGSWLPTGSMTEARSQHTATLLLSGKVLVTGGNPSVPLATATLYDPATGSWTSTGSMSTPRSGHTATLLPSGQVLVVGGNGTTLATAELYDPSTGAWTPTGNPASIVSVETTATLLLSGKVLTTGLGAVAEVYDPSTGTWTSTGTAKIVREGALALRLASGKVMLIGGGISSSLRMGAAELYDPASGTWSLSAGSMFMPRQNHAQVLLPSGQVLVAGGVSENDPTATAELYSP